MTHKIQNIALILGPLLAITAGLITHSLGWSESASWTILVIVWCAFWWVFEPIPIPITSLIPLVVLPLTGVLPMADVSAAYGNPLILLLMGGFMLAAAMEKSGAHQHLALSMLKLIGQSDRRLVLGFMITAATLSMWISNTATTLMLLPIAIAIMQGNPNKKLGLPMMLGIAYAASIGGIGTPIGTPPNLIFMQVYTENGLPEIDFVEWMSWGVPVVVIMIPLAFFWLTRSLRNEGHTELPPSSSWTIAQKSVMAVFALTALAWVTRIAPFGGWRTWFDLPHAQDSHVALLGVILLFMLPDFKGSRLMDWQTVAKIPWGALLLFAGGITIAKAFVSSGISADLGQSLGAVTVLPIILVIAIIALTVTFMTEVTSNLATTALLMPILASIAISSNIDLKLLMVPAVMSASCAFMLPVATAPNTIAYSTNKFSVNDMIREGFLLNIIGVIVITLVSWLRF